MKILSTILLMIGLYANASVAATKVLPLPKDARDVKIQSIQLQKVPSGKRVIVDPSCNSTGDGSDCRVETTPVLIDAVALKITYSARSEGHYENGSGDDLSSYTDVSEKFLYFGPGLFSSQDIEALKSDRKVRRPGSSANLEIANRFFNLEVKVKDYTAKVIDRVNSEFCPVDSEGNLYDKTCVEKLVYINVKATGSFLFVSTK